MAQLGEKIRAKRDELGWTQDDLAKRLKIRQSTVSLFETGDRIPSTELIVRLSNVLDISLDQFSPTIEEIEAQKKARHAAEEQRKAREVI